LHAVLLAPGEPAGRLLDALGAALDGTGPAILPLDAGLPAAAITRLVEAFAPDVVLAPDGRPRPGPCGPGPGRPGVAPEVAVVVATSGSTGAPKAAELTAAAMLASARASLARLGAAATPGERWLCCLPAHHVSGLGVLVRSLLSGSTPLTAPRLDAAAVARAAGTFVSLVPAQLRRLLDEGAPVDGFRAILLGGAAAAPGLLAEAAAAGARVVTTYGMSETCGGCVYDGVPLDGVRVAEGADGRIRISGPVLFSGYRLAPELTAAALDHGWFVTSDLGGPGADGRLAVRGRADDVINTGGEKVVAAEVEQVIRDCQGVRDVVVVGVPDARWGERVTAVIVPADAAGPPSLEALRSQVSERLPRHAAPQAMLVVTQIPMLASGKPDRQRLRELAGAG